MIGVVPNVHSFRDIFLGRFALIIKGVIIPDLFLHSLGKGVQDFKKPKEVNSLFVTSLMIIHSFYTINGIFVADLLRNNHRSRARTADSEREDLCLHPVPSILSQRLLVLFKEIPGLIIFCFLGVYTILVVVGGQAFSDLLIIFKI